jgi:hypothetical protein
MTAGENGERAGGENSSSDALGHFWKAAHELLLAARTVIDAADALVEEQMHGKSGDQHAPRVRRIDVDER